MSRAGVWMNGTTCACVSLEKSSLFVFCCFPVFITKYNKLVEYTGFTLLAIKRPRCYSMLHFLLTNWLTELVSVCERGARDPPLKISYDLSHHPSRNLSSFCSEHGQQLTAHLWFLFLWATGLSILLLSRRNCNHLIACNIIGKTSYYQRHWFHSAWITLDWNFHVHILQILAFQRFTDTIQCNKLQQSKCLSDDT